MHAGLEHWFLACSDQASLQMTSVGGKTDAEVCSTAVYMLGQSSCLIKVCRCPPYFDIAVSMPCGWHAEHADDGVDGLCDVIMPKIASILAICAHRPTRSCCTEWRGPPQQ